MPKKEILTAGGQAVIEGVLMRTKDKYAIAVRLPNNKIRVKQEKIKPMRDKFLQLPFIRGIVALISSLILGSKAITWSANQQTGTKEKKEEMSMWLIILTFAIAFAIAILLFKFLPLLLANLFDKNVMTVNNVWFNVLEGVIKAVILLLYLLLISQMKDVKVLFQYHGAEHKAVNCYEAGKSLTVANVKRQSRKHPRCGTSFILLVILISIVVYIAIPKDVNFWAKFGLRLALLPVIAGISFEALRLSGKYRKNIIVRAISAPGIWLQGITTKEPSNKQMEVAIKSLKTAIK